MDLCVWTKLDFDEIPPWLVAAARSEKAFITEVGTYWAFKDAEGIAAVIGFVWHSRTHVRVRGHYVPPALRGLHYGSESLDRLIEEARAQGAERMTAAVKPWLVEMYERRGFVPRREYADGEIEVERRGL